MENYESHEQSGGYLSCQFNFVVVWFSRTIGFLQNLKQQKSNLSVVKEQNLCCFLTRSQARISDFWLPKSFLPQPWCQQHWFLSQLWSRCWSRLTLFVECGIVTLCSCRANLWWKTLFLIVPIPRTSDLMKLLWGARGRERKTLRAFGNHRVEIHPVTSAFDGVRSGANKGLVVAVERGGSGESWPKFRKRDLAINLRASNQLRQRQRQSTESVIKYRRRRAPYLGTVNQGTIREMVSRHIPVTN